MYEITFNMKTLRNKKPFKYIKKSNGDKEIIFGKCTKVKISNEEYMKILEAFQGRTVMIGSSRTNPPKNSLGEWLMNNVTKQAIASYIAPVLMNDGYARAILPINSGKIEFTVVEFGKCSDCWERNVPLIIDSRSLKCANCANRILE